MGFYIRDSISVGPVRFNLSKSGVGTSVGVEGFRLGTGPSGNYVHVGKGPVRYRKRLGSGHSESETNTPTPSKEQSNREGIGEVQNVDSASASSLIDADSEEIIQEINKARSRSQFWPLIAIITVGAAMFTAFQHNAGALPVWAPIAIIAVGGFGTAFSHQRDKIRTTAALFYDFEDDPKRDYKQVCDLFESASKAKKIWNVETKAEVTDKKRHAGAENNLRTNETRLQFSVPDSVKTNIPVPSINVGKQTLFFFPDRLVIEDRGGIGALSYSRVDIHQTEQNLIMENAPGDATVVDHTWKYVNKDGTPDKRFNDNQRLPIIRVGKVRLTSPEGLEEEIMFSKSGSGPVVCWF